MVRRAALQLCGAARRPANTSPQLALHGREGWPHLPRLSLLRPELPAALDELVFRALAFDREARYHDCNALQDALEAVSRQQHWFESDRADGRWVEDLLDWENGKTDPR